MALLSEGPGGGGWVSCLIVGADSDAPISKLAGLSSLAVIGVGVWQPGGRQGAGLDCLHPLLQAATREHHIAGADTLGLWLPQVLLAVPDAIAKVDKQACSGDRDSKGSSTAWLLAPSWLAPQRNVAWMWPVTPWSKKLKHHGGLTELHAGGKVSCSRL